MVAMPVKWRSSSLLKISMTTHQNAFPLPSGIEALVATSLPQPSGTSRAHHLGSSDLQLDVQVDI